MLGVYIGIVAFATSRKLRCEVLRALEQEDAPIEFLAASRTGPLIRAY